MTLPPRFSLSALMLLCAMFLGACALRSSPVIDSEAPDLSGYESRLVDHEAKALYLFARYALLAAQGDLGAAELSLSEALRLDPSSSHLQMTQARLSRRLGNSEDAIAQALTLLDDENYGREALLMLGSLHLSLDENLLAADYYRRALELDPSREDVYLHLATTLARSGSAADAQEVLSILVERWPGSFMGHYYRARLYREMGELDASEDSLLRVLELEPSFESGYQELGEIYLARQKGTEAVELFRKALKLLPASSVLRHLLARSLIAQGEYGGASEQLQLLLKADPEDAEALRKLGLLHFELKDWPKAVEVFEALHKLRPEQDQGAYYLGSALEEQGQSEEAIRAFSKVPVASELYQDSRLHMAYLFHRIGQTEAGVAVLQDAARRQDPSLELYRYLAALYEEQGVLEAAASTLREALQAFADEPDMAYRLGVVLERLEDRDASVDALKLALQIDPHHLDALNHLAYVYAEQGEFLDQALVMAQKAMDMDESGHIVDTLGWVNFKLNRLEKARELLERAVALLPEDPVVNDHLADVYRALGLKSQAMELYLRVLELDGAAEKVREKLEALETLQ